MGVKMATPGSHCSEQLGMPIVTISKRVCKSALENHIAMAAEVENQPTPEVLDCGPILGWESVVAPVNSLARPKLSSCGNKTQGGTFHKLLGAPDATNPVGFCLMLSGKAYRERKLHLKISHFI